MAYHMMCFVWGHVDQLLAFYGVINISVLIQSRWWNGELDISLWTFFKHCYYQLRLKTVLAILLSLTRLFDIGNSLALSPNLANFFSVLFKYSNLSCLLSSTRGDKNSLGKGLSCQELRNRIAQACQCGINWDWMKVMMIFPPPCFVKWSRHKIETGSVCHWQNIGCFNLDLD